MINKAENIAIKTHKGQKYAGNDHFEHHVVGVTKISIELCKTKFKDVCEVDALSPLYRPDCLSNVEQILRQSFGAC